MVNDATIAPRTFEGPCPVEGALCPSCGQGTMRRFAQDSFYDYLKCQDKGCRKERLVLRSDRATLIGEVEKT
jgi:hypothetical protein